MASSSAKRKRVTLSLPQKLELIGKLESGHTVAQVCAFYGVKKQTVSDIKKSKEKLKKYSVSFCIDPSSSKGKEGRPKKYMRTGQDSQLDEAVLKWFRQEKSAGMLVRGVEILSAAKTLASHLGKTDFKGSDGWLWRFRNRHGLGNTIAHGEAGSADVESVEPFREQHTAPGRQSKIDSFFAPRPPQPQVEPRVESQLDSPEPQSDSSEPLEVSDSE